jgi:hypothetical protein
VTPTGRYLGIGTGRRCATFITAALIVLCLVVTGCAPLLREGPTQPGRPRLLEFRLDEGSVSSGCPVRATLRFEDPDADAAQAVMGWQHDRGSRTVDRGVIPLPIEAAQLSGKTSGEVQAPLMFLQNGTYWLSVQVVDARGGRSNILERRLNVFAQSRALSCRSTNGVAR